MLVECGFFLLFGLLQTHLVVTNEFTFKHACFVFELQRDASAIEVECLALQERIDETDITPIHTTRSFREIASIVCLELVVVLLGLPLAST